MYGYGFGWGFNYYYFIFIIPGLLITLWAQFKVKSTFNKYNQVFTLQGLTGAQAARRILDMNGLQNVRIERVAGQLSDHYDPREDIVRLSPQVYDSPTVGAVGVAAHECGHAVQHATGYAPIRIRSAIVPVANIGSSLAVPLIFIGLILSIAQLAYLGIALFSLAVIFQLVTLPVELNASRRAIQTLGGSGMLTPEENAGVRSVLTAAALTYLAGLLTSVLQLLYYVALAGGGRRRR